MPKRPVPPPVKPSPPSLTVARGDAAAKIEERIAKGRALLDGEIQSVAQLEERRRQYYTWSEYNSELLKRLFTNDSIADEYDMQPSFGIFGGVPSLQEQIADLRGDFGISLRRLESIGARLELVPEATTTPPGQPALQAANCSDRAFIVHGHDHALLHQVARFVEKLGISPVVLLEEPGKGLTVIEKLESNSNVRFAIVLLTPDDVGGAAAAENPRPRARQNVVLELGYFVGKLGRANVAVLYDESVELPSDYHGVDYVKIDSGAGWKLRLAGEMRSAGLPVDMNKAI